MVLITWLNQALTRKCLTKNVIKKAPKFFKDIHRCQSCAYFKRKLRTVSLKTFHNLRRNFVIAIWIYGPLSMWAVRESLMSLKRMSNVSEKKRNRLISRNRWKQREITNKTEERIYKTDNLFSFFQTFLLLFWPRFFHGEKITKMEIFL